MRRVQGRQAHFPELGTFPLSLAANRAGRRSVVSACRFIGTAAKGQDIVSLPAGTHGTQLLPQSHIATEVVHILAL